MRLSDLDLQAMEDRTGSNRWGAGDPRQDRRLYYASGKWIKLWDVAFTDAQSFVSDGQHVDIGLPLNNQLLGFRVGFFDRHNSTAFSDFIYDDEGLLRGYVCSDGKPVDEIPSWFARECAEKCIRLGWVMADFRATNVISLDGKISLIDFDSHFCKLDTLDLEYERKRGCLSPLKDRYFAGIIEGHVLAHRSDQKVRGSARATPGVGTVNFGDFDRLTPISRKWGEDRGRAVDRHYVQSFVSAHAHYIRGHVLEVGSDRYARTLGSNVTKIDVLHIDPEAGTSIAGDLTRLGHVPDNTFDCFVLTQVLQLIYDVAAAIETCHRILRPGGVLLATLPGISHVARGTPEEASANGTWSWCFTPYSASKLFGDVFGQGNVEIDVHGNVLTAVSFLQGLAVGDLLPSDLQYRDPSYDLVITVKATKAE